MTPSHNPMYDIIKSKILNNRPFFTGIAIILVVLYHYYCAASNVHLLSIFKRGYIGVDIFFFFSGLGLGYSYNRNSMAQFYKNRLWRIMPLYWIWAIVHLIAVGIQNNITPSFLDVFGIFTTLSYYGIGSIRSNWYLSAILLLYVAYPMLYTLTKKYKWIFLLLTIGLTFLIVYKTQLNWYHNVFIGRFYIFLLGIYVYQAINDNAHKMLFDLVAIAAIAVLGFVSLFSHSHPFDYWGTCCFCPVVIGLICMLPAKILNSKIVTFCGKYSLEIFIGNCWTMLLMTTLSNHNIETVSKSLAYFVSNALFAMVLIYANKAIQTLIKKHTRTH